MPGLDVLELLAEELARWRITSITPVLRDVAFEGAELLPTLPLELFTLELVDAGITIQVLTADVQR